MTANKYCVLKSAAMLLALPITITCIVWAALGSDGAALSCAVPTALAQNGTACASHAWTGSEWTWTGPRFDGAAGQDVADPAAARRVRALRSITVSNDNYQTRPGDDDWLVAGLTVVQAGFEPGCEVQVRCPPSMEAGQTRVGDDFLVRACQPASWIAGTAAVPAPALVTTALAGDAPANCTTQPGALGELQVMYSQRSLATYRGRMAGGVLTAIIGSLCALTVLAMLSDAVCASGRVCKRWFGDFAVYKTPSPQALPVVSTSGAAKK